MLLLLLMCFLRRFVVPATFRAAGVVLAASGVCCLQLRLYAAVHRCCRLLPAADVAAAGQDLIYSLGAAVAAAGQLHCCAEERSAV